jgi:putative flippase GtrA
MFSKIFNLYKKYEEIINYLIFGFLGVVVSVGTYTIARIWFDIVVSNVISWILAVIFMYVTNKLFVFKSRGLKRLALLKEFAEFVGARIVTLLIETGILLLCSEVIRMNDIVAKVIAQIVIIILNYILSKFWIFKKKK